MRRFRSLGFVLAVSLAAAPALAQTGTAELAGKITDQQGGVLPGVSLVVTNEDTGVFREAVTEASGNYFLSQMIPGRYRVTVQMSGFRSLERRGIVLSVGATQTLDLTLEVGAVAETITVTGDAPLVDLTSAEVGGHITAEELADLPAGNRSYMAFVGNVPGAMFVPTSGFLNDTMLANGQSAAANNVVFDGASNVDDLRGSNVGGQTRAANETIQEVQVITNQFDAEFGRASGAVINAVTKSGTNQFMGSGFAFFTGNNVTAKDYFTKLNNQGKPETSKQEWGGTMGGPIVRNKLHFFASVERLVQNRNQAATFATRPELSYSNTDDVSAWNTLWRIDHQINANNTWAFRWLRETAPQFNVLDDPRQTETSNDDETDLDQTMVATLTSVLSNTKVNTVRFGLVKEQTTHATALWRALDPAYASCTVCPYEGIRDQALLPPRLRHLSFDVQADDTMDFSLNDNYSIEDTFSWFVPDKLGRHDAKFGVRYSHIWISNPNCINCNGSYTIPSDLAFNPADPRTFPELLEIRVPGPLEYELTSNIWEAFAQDKWQIRNGLTLSVGVRYDLEVMPINEAGNPLFSDPNKYPVDTNNFSPRLGFIWNPDGEGRSVVRGGYGMFYDRTLLGLVDNFLFDTKYASSFVARFPVSGVDSGPSNGRYPTNPALNTTSVSRITPEVRAYIDSQYPPGSVRRNTATVTWDDPNRVQPLFHQTTVGYEREVMRGLSVAADYVHMAGRDQFLSPNLNIPTRLNTSRTGPLTYTDPYGILTPSLTPGEPPYVAVVRQISNQGYSDYDALNISVEKRYADSWSLRGAYSLGYSRGVSLLQADTPQLQVGTDLNLDEYVGPANTDRRHNFVVSGRMEVPRARGFTLSGMLRMLSGAPFTIHDTTFDVDRNGIGFDPLPAGIYSGTAANSLQNVENAGGRNGARSPGFVQLDMRAGYRARIGARRTLDAFVEVFNVTNRVNFANFNAGNSTNGDRRLTSSFLTPTALVATSGLPRQAQLGFRLGF